MSTSDPVDRDAYLAHAKKFKPAELAAIDSFSAWLPGKIIDCHAHCNLPGHVLSMGNKTRRHMLSTFPSYTLGESAELKAAMHPGKEIRTLRFAKTFRGIDHRAANEYLLAESPPQDRVALFGLPEDVGYTVGALSHPRVSALKMYYSYVEPTATRIYEAFPPEILEAAQALDRPIVLHLPRRLNESVEDLRLLLRDFPRLHVVLAHLGLPKFLVPGLAEAYRIFARYPQVFMDTAMCPSGDVVREAMAAFGPERIMFGSDEPLHLIRSVPYRHPERGERIVTDYPYHWADPEERKQYGHLAEAAIHCHWLALGAIREAIETLPTDERDRAKELVFHDNAKEFFGF